MCPHWDQAANIPLNSTKLHTSYAITALNDASFVCRRHAQPVRLSGLSSRLPRVWWRSRVICLSDRPGARVGHGQWSNWPDLLRWPSVYVYHNRWAKWRHLADGQSTKANACLLVRLRSVFTTIVAGLVVRRLSVIPAPDIVIWITLPLIGNQHMFDGNHEIHIWSVFSRNERCQILLAK